MGLLTCVSSQINHELWSLQQPVAKGDQIYLANMLIKSTLHAW